MSDKSNGNGKEWKNKFISILVGLCSFLLINALSNVVNDKKIYHENQNRIIKLEESFKYIEKTLMRIEDKIDKGDKG